MDRCFGVPDASPASRVAGFPQGFHLETITWAMPEIGARFTRAGSMVEHDHRQTGRSAHCRIPRGRLSSGVSWKVRYGPRQFRLIFPASTGGICEQVPESADRDLRAPLARGYSGAVSPVSRRPWDGGGLPYERALSGVTSGAAGSKAGIQAPSSWTTLTALPQRHIALVRTARRNCEVSGHFDRKRGIASWWLLSHSVTHVS